MVILSYTPLFTIYLGRVYNECGDDMKTCECEKRKTYRGEEEKKTLVNRVNRIEGQIRGIKKMIIEDNYCNDILIQLSAIENSIKSLSNTILENHLYSCVSKDLEEGNLDTIDELISLFKRFNRS